MYISESVLLPTINMNAVSLFAGPLAHAPLTSGSGIVTDFLYHNLIAEYTKLKETTDKERYIIIPLR